MENCGLHQGCPVGYIQPTKNQHIAHGSQESSFSLLCDGDGPQGSESGGWQGPISGMPGISLAWLMQQGIGILGGKGGKEAYLHCVAWGLYISTVCSLWPSWTALEYTIVSCACGLILNFYLIRNLEYALWILAVHLWASHTGYWSIK